MKAELEIEGCEIRGNRRWRVSVGDEGRLETEGCEMRGGG